MKRGIYHRDFWPISRCMSDMVYILYLYCIVLLIIHVTNAHKTVIKARNNNTTNA